MTPFEHILGAAKARPRTIVFPESGDLRTRQAVARLAADGIVRPVLLGPDDVARSPHREACRAAILDAVRSTRHAPAEALSWLDDPLHFAAAMVRAGLAKPANDLSRGCSTEDIVLVAAVTSLQSA